MRLQCLRFYLQEGALLLDLLDPLLLVLLLRDGLEEPLVLLLVSELLDLEELRVSVFLLEVDRVALLRVELELLVALVLEVDRVVEFILGAFVVVPPVAVRVRVVATRFVEVLGLEKNCCLAGLFDPVALTLLPLREP